MDTGSGLFSILDQQRQCNQAVRVINRLRDWIDWESFRKPLEEIIGYKDPIKKRERSEISANIFGNFGSIEL